MPLLWSDSACAERVHYLLARNWALYRVCAVECTWFVIPRKTALQGEAASFLEKYLSCASLFADRLVRKRFAEFLIDCKKKYKLPVAVIINWPRNPNWSFASGVPMYFIGDSAKGNKNEIAFWDIHPPSQIYELYGQKLADWLIDEGLVPASMEKDEK